MPYPTNSTNFTDTGNVIPSGGSKTFNVSDRYVLFVEERKNSVPPNSWSALNKADCCVKFEQVQSNQVLPVILDLIQLVCTEQLRFEYGGWYPDWGAEHAPFKIC